MRTELGTRPVRHRVAVLAPRRLGPVDATGARVRRIRVPAVHDEREDVLGPSQRSAVTSPLVPLDQVQSDPLVVVVELVPTLTQRRPDIRVVARRRRTGVPVRLVRRDPPVGLLRRLPAGARHTGQVLRGDRRLRVRPDVRVRVGLRVRVLLEQQSVARVEVLVDRVVRRLRASRRVRPASAAVRFSDPRTATASTPAAIRVDIPIFLRIDLDPPGRWRLTSMSRSNRPRDAPSMAQRPASSTGSVGISRGLTGNAIQPDRRCSRIRT